MTEPTTDTSSRHSGDSAGDDTTTGAWRARELRWALSGGFTAAGAVFVVTALVGQVSGFEARRLVEGIKPTATFAASTYIGTGATILALMSTVIAFSISHESDFRRSHYRRLRLIAASTTALILNAIALMTCLVIPIAQADAGSPTGYVILYWAILILGSIGGGLTVSIVLMLNYAVRGLVDLGTDGSSFLTIQENTEMGPS